MEWKSKLPFSICILFILHLKFKTSILNQTGCCIWFETKHWLVERERDRESEKKLSSIVVKASIISFIDWLRHLHCMDVACTFNEFLETEKFAYFGQFTSINRLRNNKMHLSSIFCMHNAHFRKFLVCSETVHDIPWYSFRFAQHSNVEHMFDMTFYFILH